MRFIWKIENFSCLSKGMLQSPPFSLYDIDWDLRIYPKGYTSNNDILVNLHQLQDLLQLPQRRGIWNCAVSFLDAEHLPLIWPGQIRFYLKEYEDKVASFCIQREKVFGQRKTKFLPNDNLTVQCIIWRTDAELTSTDSKYARTRIEPVVHVQEKTFTLIIPEFSSVSNRDINHAEAFNGVSLSIRLNWDNHDVTTILCISLPLKIRAQCKISLVDASRKKIQFAEGKFFFSENNSVWKIDTSIKKDMLMCYKNEFLPNDSLSLEFKCTLSFEVSFNSLVDEQEFFANSRLITNSSHTPEPEANSVVQDVLPPNKSDSHDTISTVLQAIYEEGFMSDFSLRVQDKTFPVHKNILGARSSVFRAMFTADMKEKDNGFVDIPDVDADTVQRMLKFVYCDIVEEDMQWESAFGLYAAADKYAIQPLKQRCSVILKSRLFVSNVLEALLLGVTYQDQDLETAALGFIARNDQLIVSTEDWNKFEKDNPQTALDALRKLYVMKMNG